MPWLETDPVKERKRFIPEASGGLFSHAELCECHGISHRTGYKWLDRYDAEGPDGLQDRSHRPGSSPLSTEPHVIQAALELRGLKPRWGAGKIRARLQVLEPEWRIPSPQTLHKYFRRAGVVKPRRRSGKEPRSATVSGPTCGLSLRVPSKTRPSALPASIGRLDYLSLRAEAGTRSGGSSRLT